MPTPPSPTLKVLQELEHEFSAQLQRLRRTMLISIHAIGARKPSLEELDASPPLQNGKEP